MEVAEAPSGAADVVTVRQLSCRRLAEIPKLILAEGRLRTFRLAGRDDYGALLLDVEEVKAAVVGGDHSDVAMY